MLVYLPNHDLNFAFVAQALVEEIEVVRKNIAECVTWVSPYHSVFKYDLYVSFLPEKIAAARGTAWKNSRATACTPPTALANLS